MGYTRLLGLALDVLSLSTCSDSNRYLERLPRVSSTLDQLLLANVSTAPDSGVTAYQRTPAA